MQHREPEQVNTPVPADSAMSEYDLEDILKEFSSSEPQKPVESPKAVTAPLPVRPPVQEAPRRPAPKSEKPPERRSVWPPEEPEKAPPKKRPPRVKVAKESPPPPKPQELRERYANALHGTALRFGVSLITFLAELALVLLSEFAPQALSFASARTLSIVSAGLLLLAVLLAYDVPVQGLRDLFPSAAELIHARNTFCRSLHRRHAILRDYLLRPRRPAAVLSGTCTSSATAGHTPHAFYRLRL